MTSHSGPPHPADETPSGGTPAPAGVPGAGHAQAGEGTYAGDLASLKERLVREATGAVAMLESALQALWALDRDAAREVRKRDEAIDAEEVIIEESCLRLMALQQPFGRDFRMLTFILKVNPDLERVADHACSIAKTVRKFPQGPGVPPPSWPTALVELGQRVPVACHQLLRALLDEDVDAAKAVVAGDEVIDAMHRRLFDETLELMQHNPSAQTTGLLVYRVGRELERIGDLMTNIAEDIIYLRTGSIVRHEKKKFRAQAAQPQTP